MSSEAEMALATYRRSMEDGHPWLPGGLFISNPGLDCHILAAMEAWVNRAFWLDVQACPRKGGGDA